MQEEEKSSLSLEDKLKKVLNDNDQGNFTIPAEGLYPHQWLWDSCFIAIGLANIDIERAMSEITSLFNGQWANGMIPHMIFSDDERYHRDRDLWRSWLNPNAPEGVATSGITQPPMLAEAIVRIGKKLPIVERRTWYKTVYPSLLAYHQWLYADRDPHNEGLVIQLHPYETGLDNTPPWIALLEEHSRPWWVDTIEKLKLAPLINMFRSDTKSVPPGQRMNSIDALIYYSAILRLRRKNYETNKVLNRSLFAVEDLTFNSILVRANKHLKSIAKNIGQQLPEELVKDMKSSENALEELWDEYAMQYYSRNFVTHKMLKEPSIATLMPIYAGTVKKERVEKLINLLNNTQQFKAKYPIPSVPVGSSWFDPTGYWQGPTWINTNWLIIDGLRRYGYDELADELTQKTIELVSKSSCNEYFSPLDGLPAGARNFSWTAALTLDLLSSE